MNDLQLTSYGPNKDVRVSHRSLAEYMGLRQDAIRDLIEKYLARFEQISQCPFEMEHVERGFGGSQSIKVYYLDSDQANLLIGFSRNTDVTVELKVNVAIAFKKAKEQLGKGAKQLTVEQEALLDYEFKVKNRASISSLLGYSQGWLRKESLQIGFDIEGKTGCRVNPSFLLDDPGVGTPEALGAHEGTHAALVSAGSDGSTPTNIGEYYGVSSTVINEILVKLGYQVKHKPKKYLRTEKARFLANLGKVASSRTGDSGMQFVSGWLYNSNKAFRDEITAAVNLWKAAQLKKAGKK